MLEFSGNAGKRSQIAFIREHGMGLGRTAADYRPPRDGIPWFLDNGAFSAYRAGSAFDGDRFLKVMARVPRDNPPLFVVCPDIVAGGQESLAFSIEWKKRLDALGYGWLPWYLAVQDGMGVCETVDALQEHGFAGLFVGGTVPWKRRTMAVWVRAAHRYGKKAHVGRIGTVADLAYARSVGVDSVDSTSWAQNDTHTHVLAARQQQTFVCTNEDGRTDQVDSAHQEAVA